MAAAPVIQPNRLSVPGEAAARQRVEEVFAAIDLLASHDLTLIAIRPPRPEQRDARVARLEAAAETSGRAALLDESRDAVRDSVFRRMTDRAVSNTTALYPRPGGSSEQLAALVVALQDAVAVAVMEDLLEPMDAAALAEPGRAVLGLSPVGAPDTGAAAQAPSWEPTEADWADAQQPATTGGALLPGVRGLWQLFLGVIAVVGMTATVALGVASDQLWFGILGAVAIGAVCWTLATFRRAT